MCMCVPHVCLVPVSQKRTLDLLELGTEPRLSRRAASALNYPLSYLSSFLNIFLIFMHCAIYACIRLGMFEEIWEETKGVVRTDTPCS